MVIKYLGNLFGNFSTKLDTPLIFSTAKNNRFDTDTRASFGSNVKVSYRKNLKICLNTNAQISIRSKFG